MSHVEELEKLTALHEKGVINDKAYAMTKKKLILEMTGLRKSSPQWMWPAGIYVFWVSVLGLALLGWLKSQKMGNEEMFTELALNPLFFIGLPLSLYWMWRTDPEKHSPTASSTQ